MKAILRLFFSLLMLVGLSAQVFAQSPTITTTLANALKVNVPYDFTVSTTPGNASDTPVRIKFELANASQRTALRVWFRDTSGEVETYHEQTIAADGTLYYGDAAGFPLATAIEYFRIMFSEVGTYTYTLSIFDAANASRVLASQTVTHTVTVFEEPTINSTLDVISEAEEAGVRAGSQTLFGIFVTAGDRAGETVKTRLVLANPAQRSNIRIAVATNPQRTLFEEMAFTNEGVLHLGAEEGFALATEDKLYRINFSQPGTYSYTLQVLRGLDVLTQRTETIRVQEGNATIATTLNNRTGVKAGMQQAFALTYAPGTWPAATNTRIRLTLLDATQQDNIAVQYETTEGNFVDLAANEQGVAYIGGGAYTALGTGRTINMKATATEADIYNYRVELLRSIPNQVDEVMATSTERLEVTAFVNPTIASTLNNRENVLKNAENEFTVTVRQNDVPANTMVRGRIMVTPAQAANITLMYRETPTAPYTRVTIGADGIGYFGEATGFPLVNTTEDFKVTFSEPGTYNYTLAIVQVSNSAVLATATESVVVNNTTGIGNRVAKRAVAVYPTVSKGNVTVDLGEYQQAQVQVLDVLGRTVTTLENRTGAVQISTTQFAKGTYFVRVLKDGTSATGKFIIR